VNIHSKLPLYYFLTSNICSLSFYHRSLQHIIQIIRVSPYQHMGRLSNPSSVKSLYYNIDMRGTSLLLLILLIACALAQQICVRKECADERQQCIENGSCQTVIGEAIEKCTLQSQGCMLLHTDKNPVALKFVTCSFSKCLNI